MASLIGRIMAASGSMQKPEAHRRYLETLKEGQLAERLQALQATGKKSRPLSFDLQQKKAARLATGGVA
ncbi:MAG: hypothetical protein KGL39_39675 [Patescibacteria group bacterium]|nr:hypothetical protein [Patescibacteria group bacterium]